MSAAKNREPESLEVLEIYIDHKEETFRACPNSLIISGIWSRFDRTPDHTPGLFAKGSVVFRTQDLEPIDGLASVISGKPAVRYRSDDLAIPLTPDELARFITRSLKPEEFRKLYDHYGSFYEIHDDFYDPTTGEALQPIEEEKPGSPKP